MNNGKIVDRSCLDGLCLSTSQRLRPSRSSGSNLPINFHLIKNKIINIKEEEYESIIFRFHLSFLRDGHHQEDLRSRCQSSLKRKQWKRKMDSFLLSSFHSFDLLLRAWLLRACLMASSSRRSKRMKRDIGESLSVPNILDWKEEVWRLRDRS